MHPGVVGKTEHLHLSENMIHCVLSKMVCSKSNPSRLGMAVPGKQAKARRALRLRAGSRLWRTGSTR
jgi:hypothetical protein